MNKREAYARAEHVSELWVLANILRTQVLCATEHRDTEGCTCFPTSQPYDALIASVFDRHAACCGTKPSRLAPKRIRRTTKPTCSIETVTPPGRTKVTA